jgi:hypothetical protein
MIQLTMSPMQVPVSWAEFLGSEECFSIALDGYVIGEPRYDASRVMANFNHHEHVNRLATRATCAQVLMALRQGLFRTFRDADGPRARVLVNDCDEDVCMSWYLLKHHAVCEQPMNPLLNRLVMMEDSLDATAGAYPFPADLPLLRQLAWVFEPYRRFRLSGELDKKQAQAFRGVLEDVEGRIGRHITGNGQEIPLDLRYERLGGGKGWAMVREIGAQARTGMFSDGIQAYVSVRELGAGRWAYVVGRLSGFIPFDCQLIFDRCNAREATEGEGVEPDRWGGSDMIGGSPRVGASRISPALLQEIIDETIAEAR